MFTAIWVSLRFLDRVVNLHALESGGRSVTQGDDGVRPPQAVSTGKAIAAKRPDLVQCGLGTGEVFAWKRRFSASACVCVCVY